jgi:2-keto-3-deoxy-6-phosphogluconate aldolase
MLAGGPVPLDMIDSYLDAGCIAVNLGASIAVPDLVESEQWDEIGKRAALAASVIQTRKTVEQPIVPSYVH